MPLKDEITYAIILISSIAAGLFFRTIEKPWQKQLLSSSLGLFTIVALCGVETLHSVAAICGTLCIVKSYSRQTPLLAFIFVFSYLLFFRCSNVFGLPQQSALGNAVQLILTLKLISVAIEIHDYRQKKLGSNNEEEASATKFQLSLEEEPSFYDIICYCYCYVGLFTGPFFKYRTYQDFLQLLPEQSVVISWKEEVVGRAKQIALFGVLYFLASQLFSIEHVKADEFYDCAFWYRLMYMVTIFFLGRMRFYSAWLLSECSFVTAAFGAYPESTKPRPGHGPTINPAETKNQLNDAVKYNFETIRNINPSGSEWSKTVRDGMRNWNMSVQWWLANYVHKRWPAHLKQFRTAVVLGCSAYWHGIAPGYFGAFLTMPFIMAAEDMMIKLVKCRLSGPMQNGYDWVNWFFKMRSFEYMYMAFALLTWEDTYRWWKSVYFIGHISCILIIAFGTVCGSLISAGRRKHNKTD